MDGWAIWHQRGALDRQRYVSCMMLLLASVVRSFHCAHLRTDLLILSIYSALLLVSCQSGVLEYFKAVLELMPLPHKEAEVAQLQKEMSNA